MKSWTRINPDKSGSGPEDNVVGRSKISRFVIQIDGGGSGGGGSLSLLPVSAVSVVPTRTAQPSDALRSVVGGALY